MSCPKIAKNIFLDLEEIVYIRDTQKNILYMNKKAEEITGFLAAETVNIKKCYNVFSDSGNCKDNCPADYCLRNKCNPGIFKWSFKTREDDFIIFDASVSPLICKDGLVGNIVILKNSNDIHEYSNIYSLTIKQLKEEISKRESLEKELLESERKYRTTFEYTGTAMVVIEENRIISMANKEVERLTGYSPEEIVGKPWDYFIHPEDLSKMEKYHWERRQPGKSTPTQYEFRMLHKSGALKNIFYTVNLIPDTKKSIGSLIDITDRNKTIKDLQSSEEKYRLLLENIEDGFYEVDLDGNLLYCNDSLVKIYGEIDREALLGINYREYTYGENLSLVFRTFNNVFNSGQAKSNFNWEITRKDNTKRTVEVSVSLFKDQDGNPAGFRGIVRDVTERRQAEERLKYLSMHDAITGLYNRTYFEEEMSRINRGRFSPVTVICFDVDGLKLVNDTFGHKKGDELLKSVAEILKIPFRASDVVARTGGDEFSVILPRTDRATALKICERIDHAIDLHNKVAANLPISLSIGMDTGNISGKLTCDELYKRADNNMYRHKLQSRGRAQNVLIQSMFKALKKKDSLADGHADRLYAIISQLIKEAELSPGKLEEIRLMSLYHDIGKAIIPDNILFKDGPLNKKEWDEIKQHSETGFRVARSTPELSFMADWILSHHEYWNGKGYPQGLRGNDIPLISRIFFIADAYVTMTSDRSYRKAMSHEDAVREIERCAGTQFDPELTELFVKIMSRWRKKNEKESSGEDS